MRLSSCNVAIGGSSDLEISVMSTKSEDTAINHNFLKENV